VVDESGTPLADARCARAQRFTLGLVAGRRRVGWPSESADVHATLTGADGRFELADLPGGELRLGARKSGCAPLDRFGIALAKDAHLDLGDLTLEPGSTLAGSVVDARGAPVAGARVLRVPQDRTRASAGVVRSRSRSRPRTPKAASARTRSRSGRGS
jgi:hypothetical protein